jgi:uncharacterized protein YjbJ (UPF0337 family)
VRLTPTIALRGMNSWHLKHLRVYDTHAQRGRSEHRCTTTLSVATLTPAGACAVPVATRVPSINRRTLATPYPLAHLSLDTPKSLTSVPAAAGAITAGSANRYLQGLPHAWYIYITRRSPSNCVGDAKSLRGDAKSSLGDAKSLRGDAKSSLGDAKSSLGDAESSLGDAKSSLGDAKSSLGDAKSSLGDAKSSPGDAKRSVSVVRRTGSCARCPSSRCPYRCTPTSLRRQPPSPLRRLTPDESSKPLAPT